VASTIHQSLKLGQRLAAAQRLGGVKLWDAADGKGLFAREKAAAGVGAGSGAAGASKTGRKAKPGERVKSAAAASRNVADGDETDPDGADMVEEAVEEAGLRRGGAEEAAAAAAAAAAAGSSQLTPPGTVRGGWRWTGSVWQVADKRLAGVSDAGRA
jgi:hypothetical protein